MKDLKLRQEIIQRAQALKEIEDIRPLVESIKNKRVVLLGESSHGTQEFYQWRHIITRLLVEEHGYNLIAVEGDWPSCQKINEFIQEFDGGNSAGILSAFSRWPTWMWANTEMVEVVEWMRGQHIGFHGLDVYSFFESMEEAILQLGKIDPELARRITQYYSCFESFDRDEIRYAKSLVNESFDCHEEVVAALQDLLELRINYPVEYPYALFNATQNARIVKNGERYYRSMILGDEDSWNIRDQHMLESLDNLLNFYGNNSKAIVWAHNTHIGDYKATDMVLSNNINLGGLAREKYGSENVALIGFGTHHGKVIASHRWDGPIQVLEVPAAKTGSLEDLFHQTIPELNHPDFFILMDETARESALADTFGHRAIGVVYHPDWESKGNYVNTSLAKRYDAFIYLDETEALTPLNYGFDPHKIPETYPFVRD